MRPQYRKNAYNSQYKPLYRPSPQLYRPQRFTKMDRVRKLAGTQPETTIEKISKGVGTVATIAKTVAGIVSVINTEDKYIDTQIATSMDNTGGMPQIVLNAIATGSDRNQRNGNKILNKSLQLSYQCFMQAADTAPARTVRLVLLIDKKPQIGNDNFSNIYTPVQPWGLIDKDSKGDRYVILKDWKIILSNGNERVSWEQQYISLDRLHTQYFSTTATSFESGKIMLVAISDAPNSSSVLLNGTARFAYTDN